MSGICSHCGMLCFSQASSQCQGHLQPLHEKKVILMNVKYLFTPLCGCVLCLIGPAKVYHLQFCCCCWLAGKRLHQMRGRNAAGRSSELIPVCSCMCAHNHRSSGDKHLLLHLPQIKRVWHITFFVARNFRSILRWENGTQSLDLPGFASG